MRVITGVGGLEEQYIYCGIELVSRIWSTTD